MPTCLKQPPLSLGSGNSFLVLGGNKQEPCFSIFKKGKRKQWINLLSLDYIMDLIVKTGGLWVVLEC